MLPIADYITDTISVLDQSIRVLQAYIDITAEQGCLSTTLMLIRTMVSVKQAIWDDSNPATILPGTETTQLSKFRGSLMDLPRMDKRQLLGLARSLGVKKEATDKFVKVAESIPTLRIKPVQAQQGSIRVELHRTGQSYGPEFRAYTPLFPKAQTEGWFVFLCDSDNDEILALKRASFTQQSKTTAKLGVPEECKDMQVELLIVSDTYPGVQYKQTIQLLGDEVTVAKPTSKERPIVMAVDTGAAKTESQYVTGQQLE